MDWKAASRSVKTRSPLDPDSESLLRCALKAVQVASKTGYRNKVFQLFYNILGYCPPVNNIGYHEREAKGLEGAEAKGLSEAHALFKGIKRPMTGKGLDGNIYIYVTKHDYVYKYVPDMVCVAELVKAPQNALFIVYVVFDDATCETGEILNWEWVYAEDDDPLLPKDHATRYDTRVW